MITAVVGAQYGSEGKGVIVRHIADRYSIHVRTGGSNAGHTLIHRGKRYAMQVIPVGWVNMDAILVLGAGGVIDIEILKREINMLLEVDPNITNRIYIDRNSGLILPSHYAEEGGVKGELHKRIGSTGKGVGAARISRLQRDVERFPLVRHYAENNDFNFDNGTAFSELVTDTVLFLHQAIHRGENVLLEGTQGSGLSLVHGPYPYVTSADTNAAQLAADAGIPPHKVDDVILVARTYPIRVAGNSGPLRNEITWEDISKRMGKPTEEKTTVTKKTRRIGEWDEELVIKASILNSPTRVAITFIDYLSPEDEGKTEYEDLSSRSKNFIEYAEVIFDAPVIFIGTGGASLNVIEIK